MRYRPFGRTGVTISNLTLCLGSQGLVCGPDATRDLIFAALEAGINSFHLETADPVLGEVVGKSLATLDRKLVGVTLTLGQGDGRRGSERDFSPEGMTAAIDRVLNVSGLGWIDLIMLDEPQEQEFSQTSLNALKAQRTSERIKMLGISGEGEIMDAYVSTNAFDVLATPLHANSHWMVRSRVRAARERDMAVMAYGIFPEELRTEKKAATVHQPKKGLFGKGDKGRPKSDPLAGAGTFAFLHRTHNWTAEEICLAYALTDPSVSSVLVAVDDAERLATLAGVPERDLPPGLSAQIEMARVRMAAA